MNIPASSITAISIQHIPWAKVVMEDLINLQLRWGLPNTLVVTASDTGRRVMSESTSSHGKGETTGIKNKPRPPLESRALPDITGNIGGGSGGAARGIVKNQTTQSQGPPSSLKLSLRRVSLLTIHTKRFPLKIAIDFPWSKDSVEVLNLTTGAPLKLMIFEGFIIMSLAI